MNIKTIIAVTLAFAATTVLAGNNERGRWTFSIGPSWRSQVKVDTYGRLAAPATTPRSTDKRDMLDYNNWTDPELVKDPAAGRPPILEDAQVWGVSDVRTETYGVAGRDYLVNSSEEFRPLGLNLQTGFDFYQGENLSLGLTLRFAGYWNMKSTTYGRFNAGLKRTDTYTDNYFFPFEDPESPLKPSKYVDIYPNGSTLDNTALDFKGSRFVGTKLSSDLYQIGLGPKIVWTPCSCLDIYVGGEVLFNFANTKFQADYSSRSCVDSMIGFGVNAGFVGNFTENFGLYGQIGYEWIKEKSISVQNFKADIDYTSLVVSAGVQFRF